MKHLYKDITAEILMPDKTVILENMIEELPIMPWADINTLDWLPDDNKLPVKSYLMQHWRDVVIMHGLQVLLTDGTLFSGSFPVIESFALTINSTGMRGEKILKNGF